MIAGVTTLDGRQIAWKDLSPIRDAKACGCSPATLASLKRHQTAREGIDPTQITASEGGKGIRLLLLERTVKVFPTVGDQMAAQFGTMKHSDVNQDEPGMIVETRFTSDDGRFSGQIDHAAVSVEGPPMEGIVVDLFDLKTGGYYAAKLFRADPLGDKAEYTYQINLCADLMEQFNYRVRNMFVEWIPRDLKATDPVEDKVMLIRVPRLAKAITEKYFGSRHAALAKAIEDTTCPPCSQEERWERSGKEPMRCLKYCAYLDDCMEMSVIREEEHPVTAYLAKNKKGRAA